MKLNGWRRLGVVLSALWIAGLTGFVLFEYRSDNPSIFVDGGLPIGSHVIMSSGVVKLPDGQELKFDKTDPETGERLMPWEVDWRTVPELRKYRSLKWTTLALFFAAPALLWGVFEFFVFCGRWVRDGFRKKDS